MIQFKRETVWMLIGAIALASVLALAFRAYLHPDMLLDITSLVLCT